MPGVTLENVDAVFTYHSPDSDQEAAYKAVREDAKLLAETILNVAPVCADQQAALRKLREAVMTANAAIALKGAI